MEVSEHFDMSQKVVDRKMCDFYHCGDMLQGNKYRRLTCTHRIAK